MHDPLQAVRQDRVQLPGWCKLLPSPAEGGLIRGNRINGGDVVYSKVEFTGSWSQEKIGTWQVIRRTIQASDKFMCIAIFIIKEIAQTRPFRVVSRIIDTLAHAEEIGLIALAIQIHHQYPTPNFSIGH